jgi:hypothetical protein
MVDGKSIEVAIGAVVWRRQNRMRVVVDDRGGRDCQGNPGIDVAVDGRG